MALKTAVVSVVCSNFVGTNVSISSSQTSCWLQEHLKKNKQLTPNSCDYSNISDDNSMLCHQQSNDVGSKSVLNIEDDDFGLSEKASLPTPSSSYIGLRNMSKMCYINVLLQWLLHLVPFRNALLKSHVDVDVETLSKRMRSSGIIFPTHTGYAQVTLYDLAQGFLELQSLCRKMLSSRSGVVDPRAFIDAIGFPHNQSDCCHNAWITLFQVYFDFLKLSSRYRGFEVFKICEQPQPFSCLHVYLSSMGLGIR